LKRVSKSSIDREPSDEIVSTFGENYSHYVDTSAKTDHILAFHQQGTKKASMSMTESATGMAVSLKKFSLKFIHKQPNKASKQNQTAGFDSH
jgi:hypothetical protein